MKREISGGKSVNCGSLAGQLIAKGVSRAIGRARIETGLNEGLKASNYDP